MKPLAIIMIFAGVFCIYLGITHPAPSTSNPGNQQKS